MRGGFIQHAFPQLVDMDGDISMTFLGADLQKNSRTVIPENKTKPTKKANKQQQNHHQLDHFLELASGLKVPGKESEKGRSLRLIHD